MGEVLWPTLQDHWKASGGDIINTLPCAPGLACVVQLACYQQQSGDVSCGYFCLHNLQCLLCCALSEDATLCEQELRAMHDSEAFERRKDFLADLLIHEGKKAHATDPVWSESHIRSGVLERDHLSYFLRGGHILHSEFVECLLEAGAASMVSLEIPLDTLDEFDAQVARVKKAQGRAATALIIGATLHWTVLVVLSDGNQHLHLFFCDSQNQDILASDTSTLQALATKCPFKAWLARGWPRATMEELQVDSWQGVQFVVEATRAASGGSDTVKHSMAKRWLCDGFWKSWQDVAPDVKTWTAQGWHASFLEAALLPVARVGMQDPFLRNLLLQWATEVTAALVETAAETGLHADEEHQEHQFRVHAVVKALLELAQDPSIAPVSDNRS